VIVHNIASKNACCKACLLEGSVLLRGVEPNLLCGRVGARILCSVFISRIGARIHCSVLISAVSERYS
jgi:hypothetical protein